MSAEGSKIGGAIHEENGLSPDEDTLPKLLLSRLRQRPDQTAMRVKDRGIWRSYTTREYYENVKWFCLGLVSLGLKRRGHISIIGENKPEWYWAELAVQSVRGAAVGIFADCAPHEVKYFVKHSDSKFVVAHDQEQVDKLLEIQNEVPHVKKIIFWDSKGMWSYKNSILMSFQEVLDMGRAYERDRPDIFEELISQGKGEDIAVICYTSGTTDLPKGVMLNQRSILAATVAWSKVDKWFAKDYEYVSFIPPAWTAEQTLGVAGSLGAGVIVNFPEKPETVQEDLREIGPDMLFYGAKLWESVNRMLQAKIMDSTFLRRLIYRTFMPVGLKVADTLIAQKELSIFLRILYFVAYQAIFRQLIDRLGLKKVKVAYSAGGALSPEIIRQFKAMGMEIKLVYGITEAGMISVPRDGEIRPESSGRVLPWVQVKISRDGEILVKNRYMFSGYYKNPDATLEKFKDGWYCTGDFGHLDGGHLIVIDRMNDLKPVAGGKQFSPQHAEVRLRFSPFVKDVIVFGGEQRPFVSAIVNIDIENVGRYADAQHISYTTFADLSQQSEVIQLIKSEIDKLNKVLPEHARIKRFVNLHKEFDADEAELTRTRKLKRTFVEERYRDLVDGLYGKADEIIVGAKVTYSDGRKGIIETGLKVNRLE